MPPTNRAFDIALQSTVDKFRKRLTKKELDGFQVTTLNNVKIAVVNIQREREDSKKMNNLQRLQSFLEGMDQLGKVVEVFLNVSELVAFIWGPIKFVLLAANTHLESLNTLVEAYESIGEQLPLLETYRTLFEQNPDMQKALVWIYEDILEFHQGALRHFHGNFWKQVFQATWNDFKSRFGDILTRLGRHGAFVKDQANALHIQAYARDNQKLQQQISTYARDRKLDLERFEAQHTADTRRLLHDTLLWISAADVHAEQAEHCKVRAEDDRSGQWILKHHTVLDWKDEEVPNKSIFWLHGKPGAGKSVLASVLISSCRNVKDYTTTFFYCRYNDPERRTALAVLRALISQLLVSCPELLPPCNDKRWKLGKGETTLNLVDSAKTLFELCCKRRPKQYIIIDGLDECEKEERKILFGFFKALVRDSDLSWNMPGTIRVLFVSQYMPDIFEKLSPDVAVYLQMSNEDNEDDISRYINIWADKVQKKHKLDDAHKDIMIRSTLIGSSGMFLFAKLVMQNLLDQTSTRNVKNELRSTVFPKGLPDAYERILDRMKRALPPTEWKDATKLMGWMICAKRPLRPREIRGALSIDQEQGTVDLELDANVDLQALCAPLVQESGGVFQLVHKTAASGILSSGCVSEPIVECNLTTLCLNYLTFRSFDKALTPAEITKFAIDGHYMFLDYATAKWIHHFQATVLSGGKLCTSEGGDRVETASTQNRDSIHHDEIDMGSRTLRKQAKDALCQFENALEVFCETYEAEFSASPNRADQEACQALGKHMSIDSMKCAQYVFTHIKNHLAQDFRTKADVSMKVLGASLTQIRQTMELYSSTTKSEAVKERFEILYGVNVYKCPKTTCHYYHQGFQDQKSRDAHINDHDRPYQCDVPNCMHSELGFRYNKDLDKHKKEWHPSLEDLETSFTIPEKPIPKGRAYRCDICGRSFTRSLNLKDHKNSHLGERPFPCSECGKSFTRANDCRRHERTVHVARRRQ